MATLVRQLADTSSDVRDKAARELIARGLPVVALLRRAARDSDADVARRADECLRDITKDYEGVDLIPGAARLLALRRPAGALGDFFGPGTTVGIPFAAQVGVRVIF